MVPSARDPFSEVAKNLRKVVLLVSGCMFRTNTRELGGYGEDKLIKGVSELTGGSFKGIYWSFSEAS